MYVDMRTQTWPRSPGINVATHKSQSCLVLGVPLAVHMSCIACGSQSSTSHACCRTARASLRLLKRSFGLRCDAGPFSGLWDAGGLHAFCLHVKPASWHQAQENINERCNLPQLNVLFTEGKTHIPWAQNCGHKFGSRATNFSIVAQFLGPESGPCFGAHKTQTGAIQYWQQVRYCRRKLTAAHIRDTVIIHIPDLNQSKPQMLNDQRPRPASIRRSLGVGMWMTKEGIQRMTMGGRLKMTWTNRNQPWWLLKMDPWNPWQISQRSRVVPNALANHQIPSGI